jgi:hypothetical protein
MSIKVEYGASFREQLHHFPVWDVGSAISLGDYGTVDGNCFSKLGNISDWDIRPELDTSMPPAAYYEFTSEGTKVVNTGAAAAVAGAKAALEVHFETAFSMFVRADQSHVVSMANAGRVGNQLKSAVGWKKKYCWVSSVRVAHSVVLLMNTRGSSSIRLEGDPGALGEVAAGKISGSASASVTVTGDAGLRYLGGAGAIYVDLMHHAFLGGTEPQRADADGAYGEAEVLLPETDIQR